MASLFIRHWACRMKGVIRNAANKVSLRIPKEGRKSGFTDESQVQRHSDGLWLQINGAKQRARRVHVEIKRGEFSRPSQPPPVTQAASNFDHTEMSRTLSARTRRHHV